MVFYRYWKCGNNDLDKHPNVHHGVGHDASKKIVKFVPFQPTFPFVYRPFLIIGSNIIFFNINLPDLS